MLNKNKITKIRNLGFKKTVLKIILIALSLFVSFRIIYKLDIKKLKKVKDKNNYNFYIINLADLELLFSSHKEEVTKERYNDLKKIIESVNSVCYIIKDKFKNICGYGCLAFGKEKHSKIFNNIESIKINENGYLFRDYTFKKYRNSGVQTSLIKKRLELLNNKGYKTATVRIALGNVASEKAFCKFGFTKELLEIHFHFFNKFPDSNYWIKKVRKQRNYDN